MKIGMIAKLRNQLLLTRESFSTATGIPVERICQLEETEDMEPSQDEKKRIIHTYNLPVHYFRKNTYSFLDAIGNYWMVFLSISTLTFGIVQCALYLYKNISNVFVFAYFPVLLLLLLTAIGYRRYRLHYLLYPSLALFFFISSVSIWLITIGAI